MCHWAVHTCKAMATRIPDAAFLLKILWGSHGKCHSDLLGVYFSLIEYRYIIKIHCCETIIKMASRGPRDASSTNCPEFGDQLNGRTFMTDRNVIM